MSNRPLFALASAAFMMSAAPAFAVVSIVNQTDKTHTVTFDHGDTENKHSLAPDATVEEACPNGCGVRFSGHDYMAADGSKLAIIEGATRPVRLAN